MDIEDLRKGLTNPGGSVRPREESQDLALENQRLKEILDSIAHMLTASTRDLAVDGIRFIMVKHGGYAIEDVTYPGAANCTEHLSEPPKKV